MAPTPTAEEISQSYDFTGKVALVSGANTGLGKETAKVLALRNAHVLLGSRSLEKGEQARQDILSSIGQDKAHLVEVVQLDLSSLDAVRDFAKRFATRKSTQLDLLINNAGTWQLSLEKTPDGFEPHFGVNHLATFLLTLSLLPYLKARPSARVVILSSAAHNMLGEHLADLDDVNLTRFGDKLTGNEAYAFSKLYNIWFSDELNRRLAGTGVISSSVHPGLIITELGRQMGDKYAPGMAAVSTAYNIPIISIPQGAATTLYAAGSPEVKGGEYLADCGLAQKSAQAQDEKQAKKLWEVSEKLAKISFP